MTSFIFHLRHVDLATLSCLRWMCYWFSFRKSFTLARLESAWLNRKVPWVLTFQFPVFWHTHASKGQKCRSTSLNCVLGIRHQRKWKQPSSKWWQKDTDFSYTLPSFFPRRFCESLSSLRPIQNNRLKPVLRLHYYVKIKIIYLKLLWKS